MSFIAEIGEFAVEDMMRSGVLASITMAQGILESAEGNHAPENNFFGIKSWDENEPRQLLWTSEYVKGKWVRVQAWFKSYPDLEGCIADHSDFLTRNTRYANAGFFAACANLDYRKAAQSLKDAGYATDPEYANSLIKIIEKNNLIQYDKEAFVNMQAIETLKGQVQTLFNTAEAHIEVINDLKEKLTEKEAPDWAKASVEKALKAGVISTPTGSRDFFRLVVMMDNAGLLK